ncbi:MAG: hypothetical protein R2771_02210 [Saprospiraceae bacterium]
MDILNKSLKNEKYNILPEKIIQFGNGVLLRGLPDYYIHKSNLEGEFNGSIVVVKSTEQNKEKSFKSQDYLYTTIVRGVENDKLIDNYFINSSISRMLTANTQWDQVLKCAENHEINIVFQIQLKKA